MGGFIAMHLLKEDHLAPKQSWTWTQKEGMHIHAPIQKENSP
jgi:hypothetical protein